MKIKEYFLYKKYNRNNGNSWQYYSKNGWLSGKLEWNTPPERLYEILDNASNKSSNDFKTDQKSEEKKNESDKSDHVQNIYGRRQSFWNNQTRQTSNVSNTPFFGFSPRHVNYISNNNTQVPPPVNNTQQTNNQQKSSSKNKEDNGHISLFH